MLAQPNSKQKSIFFIKPTVIDKLISKNRSSIQNNLLYTNEDSDGSLSEDSEISSSSSQDSSFASPEQFITNMAPIRRSEKSSVLGSKLTSRSQFAIKRGRGRSNRASNQLGQGRSNINIIAAKKVLENSKRGSNKIVRNIGSVNAKRSSIEEMSAIVKRPRASVKKEIPSPTKMKTLNINETEKPSVSRKRVKDIKTKIEDVSKSPHKSPLASRTNSLAILNIKSSPRKFPSNIMDRWKSTGMVIRGRGRPRGSFRGRGSSCRGGVRIGALRSDRYNTRDKLQSGLMRSGKRRKCSNPDLVGGLEDFKKRRRRNVTRIKTEKIDCPSDEHSSFVTTSELSFRDIDTPIKQSDDESCNAKEIKIKQEIESDEESTRDTNSNVFKSNTKTKKQSRPKSLNSSSDTNDQSNNSITLKYIAGSKKVTRRIKGLNLLEKKVVSQSDSSFRDSDCSVDSDFTEDPNNSPKSENRRHRRKAIDGSWVRRSTRSVGKNNDKTEPDAIVIEELLKETDVIVVSSSKLSDVEDITSGATSFIVSDKKETEQDNTNKVTIETPLKEDNIQRIESDSTEIIKSTLNCSKIHDIESKVDFIIDERNVLENDSLVDFDLTLEETPEKDTPTSTQVEKSLVPLKLELDLTQSNEIECINSVDIKINSPVKQSVVESQLNILENVSVKVCFTDENRMNSSVKEPTVELQKPIFGEKCVDTNLTEFSSSNSNNNEMLDIEQIRNKDKKFVNPIDDIRKINKTSDLLSVEVNDSMSVTIVKTNEQMSNDKDFISDEKILSMIDSFCQSDTTDLSTDENTQESSTIECTESDDKIASVSVKEVISEDKNAIAEEDGFKILTDTINSLSTKVVDQCLKEKESTLTSLKKEETVTEVMNSTDLVIKDFPTEVTTVDLTDKKIEEKTESDDKTKLENSFSNTDFNNMHINNRYEENIRMEIDHDNAEKAPDMTEESSSSDSTGNSNMSEMLTTHLENDSAINNLTNNQTQEKDEDIKLIEEETVRKLENDSVLKEVEHFPKIRCTSFSSLANLESHHKIGETNKETFYTDENVLSSKTSIEDSTEERPSKELLSALGLQSLHSSAAEEKPKRPNESYTGTLKAVIKLNRSSDKRSGGRKMIFKQGDKLGEDSGGGGDRLEYRICSAEELSTEGVPLTHLGDIPANRKTQMKVKSQFDLSNSPNIIGAAGSTDIAADANKDSGGKQNLIIPEKSSSFSIHPERLCTDVCSYCFGKFGSLDTPCHLAQLKNAERQAKILAIEVHLSADSCLCDGCFRYVDRKANCPTSQRSRKPAARRGPLAGTICAVQDCSQPARHSVRRKWLIKLKKSIGKKLIIDMDKNPHLPFPLCSQHYYWVDYFTVCGICKKRLTRNHMYALGPEADELNQALSDDGIPVRLSDKLFLCKLCRYYSSLRLKYRDPNAMSSTHRLFLNSYRKKILQYHDIPVSDSEEDGKSLEDDSGSAEVQKSKKKKSKSKSIDGNDSKKRSTDKEGKIDHSNDERSNDSQMIDYSYLDTLNVHREEPTTPTVDYSTLGDFEGQVGFSNIASFLNPLEGGQGTVYPTDSQNRSRVEKPTRIQVKFGNLNIGKLSNLNIGQDTRPASSSTTALERPPYLPGERDLKLTGEFEFHGALNQSSGWERCTSTIQFDRDTKKLWHELQRPYGNQSSFLRHLIMLEKHWRNGSLVLSENPNPRAVKYINSVQNRVQAYDGGKSSNVGVEKVNQPEVIVTSPPPRPMSTPLKTMSAPPPLMKIAPGSTPWLHEQLRKPPPYNFPVTSTHMTATSSRPGSAAPPPYRFPNFRPHQIGPRSIRVSTPSLSYTQNNKGQQNVRPVSISYQQFKKIRLERPPATVNKVTVVPKTEPATETQTAPTNTSSSSDFVPLICDVVSLAPTSSDWNESFRKQQQKLLKQNVAKYYTPILPKMPNSLTVTTFPQTSALVMKTTSLTIEKAPNVSTKPSIIPPEKPSISVFRETTPSENG